MSNLNRLEEAFRDCLGLDGEVQFETLAYGITSGWDSVAHLQLVAGLEEAFDIMIDTDDVIAMADFTASKAILANNYAVRFDA
jgi:acyl carrier protein